MKRVDAFAVHLTKLAAYKKKYGNTNVPRTHHDKDLAQWVRNVRAAWRAKQLTTEQLDQLADADFCFEPLESAWQEQYAKLVRYVHVHGDAKVPRDYKDHPLAVWVMHQRDHMKQGILEDVQIGRAHV